MQLYLEIPPYDTTIQEHHTINKLAQFKYRKELDDKCQWFIVLLYGDLRVVCGTVVWLIDFIIYLSLTCQHVVNFLTLL